MLFTRHEFKDDTTIVLITFQRNGVEVQKKGDALYITPAHTGCYQAVHIWHEMGFKKARAPYFSYPLSGKDDALHPFEQELGREVVKYLNTLG